jgi:hypothetical protein
MPVVLMRHAPHTLRLANTLARTRDRTRISDKWSVADRSAMGCHSTHRSAAQIVMLTATPVTAG